MRKHLVLTVAALTLVGLTACSTKSNSSGGGPSGTSSTPASTKLGQGVTADSIKLGITYVDLAAIRNVINLDQGDFQKAFNAVIDNVNSNGGVNGRKIVPVYAAINPLGSAPAAAACTKLTEDDKVFAVLGFFQTPDVLCYVKTHDTPIFGTSLTPDQAAVAKQPAFDMALSPEHLADKSIPTFAKQGVFTGHKIAVVGATADETVMNDTIIPALKKENVNIVQTAINDTPTTDVPAGYAKYNVIAQKFQSAGADVVVAVGTAGDSWPRALQVNHSSYRPRLIATDWKNLAAYAQDKQGHDESILKNALGADSAPDDVDTWNEANMQKCAAIVKSANPSEQINDPNTATTNTANTWVSVENACRYVNLFVALAKVAGSTLNNDTLLHAGNTASNVTVPGQLSPLNYSPNYHDGNGQAYIYTWNTSTDKFVLVK